jgi:uncharacterized protein
MKNSLASPANDYAKALNLMEAENPDFVRVADLLVKSAEKNFGPSVYAVATWYLHGFYFNENIRMGTKYLIKAAKLGVPEACFDLAVSYEKGISVKQNSERAFHLYLEACFRGDVQARIEVARCFWYGIGVKANRNVADSVSRFYEFENYRLPNKEK